jgi:SNF2 family DNA or RNA helicase
VKNPLLTRLDQEIFREFCAFFRLKPGVASKCDPVIRIKGLRQNAIPYQAFAAMWMLVQDQSGIKGGLIADTMGLGKVITCIHALGNIDQS